jgi:ribosomal protein S27AE
MTKAEVKSWRYVSCPNCGQGQHWVEHLLGEGNRTAGPWSCGQCGVYFRLTIRGEDVFLVMTDECKTRELIELEIPPQQHSIHMLLVHERRTSTREPDADHAREYYYEEHTCPINWINRVVHVALGDDQDPHGIAKYVRHIGDFKSDAGVREFVDSIGDAKEIITVKSETPEPAEADPGAKRLLPKRRR